MHFNAKYTEFLKENNFDPKDRMIQSAFYPIMIREFFKQTFDQELCQTFFNSLDKKIEMNKVYFKLGAFLMPTFSINSIQINRNEIIKKLRFSKSKI